MRKSKALELLRTQLTNLRQFRYQEDSPDKWRRDTRVVLEKVFGQDSPQAKEFERVRFGPGGFVRDKSRQLALDTEAFNRAKPRAVSLLESMISEVEKFWQDVNADIDSHLAPTEDGTLISGESAKPPLTPNVAFAKGRVYDVWHAVECKFREARDHVWLEDPYINGDVVELLAKIPEQVPVRVLTREFYDLADASLRKLGQQRAGRLEVKATVEIHGRRLFVDERVWSTSESIKDLAGKTASTVILIDSPDDAAILCDNFEGTWKASQRRYCNDKGNKA